MFAIGIPFYWIAIFVVADLGVLLMGMRRIATTTRRLLLTILVLPPLILSAAWASIAISSIFYDSVGNYRSPGIFQMAWGFSIGLVPIAVLVGILYRIWKSRRAQATDANYVQVENVTDG